MSTGEQWWRDLTGGIDDDPVYWAESIANTLAIKFKKQLDKKSMTQKKLSSRLEVSKSYVSQVLNGKSNMTLITLCKLAHALDLRPTVEMGPKNLEVPELDTTDVQIIFFKSFKYSYYSEFLGIATAGVMDADAGFLESQPPRTYNIQSAATPVVSVAERESA